jgi:tRNA pseudouridine38-40 synthase
MQRNDNEQAVKRQRVDKGETELPIYATKFSDEVLAGEERRPKKKVAVLIGYAGTGIQGNAVVSQRTIFASATMTQKANKKHSTHDHKTIEGDLFKAFVAAGAISKANADDPKKSSFVMCSD